VEVHRGTGDDREAAFAAATGTPSGPAFVDFPMDVVFMESDIDADCAAARRDPLATPAAEGVDRAIELLRAAERPVIMAGTGLYWAHGEQALRALSDELRVPVFVNGLGRGCIARRPRAVLLPGAWAGAQRGRPSTAAGMSPVAPTVLAERDSRATNGT